MKKTVIILPLLAGCIGPSQTPPIVHTNNNNGIPIFKNEAKPVSEKKFVYSESPPATFKQLISPEQAQGIMEQFKLVYAKMGAPRIDVRVNLPYGNIPASPLPGIQSGPIINPATDLPGQGATGARPAIPLTSGGLPGTSQSFDSGQLADRQTRRDVERLFGRPLRLAGVQLVDADLTNLPEVTFEVLISERNMLIQGISREKAFKVPDIQVTAIRLTDARILGQATVMDLFPQKEQAAHLLRRYDIRQLTEATALALMQDIASTAD